MQTIQDNTDGIDGLDNPRAIYLNKNNSKVFVTSGDDNSLAIFSVNKKLYLSLNQLFRNDNEAVNGLEGASQLAISDNEENIYVVGFYDGALSHFSRGVAGEYSFVGYLTDGVSPIDVFKSNGNIQHLDTLGLLGAWGIALSNDDKQLFVASYKSDALSIFDVSSTSNIKYNGKISLNKMSRLGNPVAVALDHTGKEVYLLGYEGDSLSIFERDGDGKLSLKQLIQNNKNNIKQFRNPQFIEVSIDGKYLYVACSGSDSLFVFKRNSTGQFNVFQTILNPDVSNNALLGAGSAAVSKGGGLVAVAGERGNSIALFEKDEIGNLKEIRFTSKTKMNIKGVSSIKFFNDGIHFLVASSVNDSLTVYRIERKAMQGHTKAL